MSDGREEVFQEEKKKAKPKNIALTTESRNDLEGMELGNEGNLDEELGLDADDEEGSNEDGDEHIRIKADFSKTIAERYQVEGQPDYYNFHTEPLQKLADNHTTTTVNDYYLQDFDPIPMFGASIRALDKRYAYQLVSAYSKKDHRYTDFTERYMPRHGTTEGGKGLSLYTHVVIYHSADMCFPLYSDTNTVEVEGVGPVSLAQIIKQNQVGIRVKTPEGIYTEITHTHINPRRDVYEYTLEDGTTIECTSNHVFLTLVEGQEVELPISEIEARGLPLLKC